MQFEAKVVWKRGGQAFLAQLGKNAEHKIALMSITLRPHVIFSGTTQPDTQQLAALHHTAHEQCYIANALKTDVRVEALAL